MGNWKKELCGCCNNTQCGACCLACVAPPWQYYTNLSIMKKGDARSNVPYCGDGYLPACICGTAFYGAMVGPCIYCCTLSSAANATAVLLLVPCAMHCVTRGNIREKSKIDLNACEDCCVVMCCYSCALVQEGCELSDVGGSPAQINSMDKKEDTELTGVSITAKDVKGN